MKNETELNVFEFFFRLFVTFDKKNALPLNASRNIQVFALL